MRTPKNKYIPQWLVALLFCATTLHAQATRPETEKQLAHDIYKEFVEIQSAYTTGATTPVAEAAARAV